MWVNTPKQIISDRELKFNPGTSNRFAIKIPKIKENWDLSGWVYLKLLGTEIGDITNNWQRVYFGNCQEVYFYPPNCQYELVFNAVSWLPSLLTYNIDFTCWRWEPTYKLKYIEQEISPKLIQLLPLNFSRKDYSVSNLGPDSIELFWGETESAIELKPGFELEESNGCDKRSLSVKAQKIANVRIAERSEI